MTDTRNAVAAIAAFLLMLAAMGFVFFMVARDRDNIFDAYQSLQVSQQYFFDGANKRGLLDICANKDGKNGVWFKEDCK